MTQAIMQVTKFSEMVKVTPGRDYFTPEENRGVDVKAVHETVVQVLQKIPDLNGCELELNLVERDRGTPNMPAMRILQATETGVRARVRPPKKGNQNAIIVSLTYTRSSRRFPGVTFAEQLVSLRAVIRNALHRGEDQGPMDWEEFIQACSHEEQDTLCVMYQQRVQTEKGELPLTSTSTASQRILKSIIYRAQAFDLLKGSPEQKEFWQVNQDFLKNAYNLIEEQRLKQLVDLAPKACQPSLGRTQTYYQERLAELTLEEESHARAIQEEERNIQVTSEQIEQLILQREGMRAQLESYRNAHFGIVQERDQTHQSVLLLQRVTYNRAQEEAKKKLAALKDSLTDKFGEAAAKEALALLTREA